MSSGMKFQTLQEFTDDQNPSNPNYVVVAQDGHYDAAAVAGRTPQDDKIDRVMGAEDDRLYVLDTRDARRINGPAEFEYSVDVEVFDRDGEQTDEDHVMFLSDGADRIDGGEWVSDALAKYTDDEAIDIIDSEAEAGGEIQGLLEEEEEMGDGYAGIDRV